MDSWQPAAQRLRTQTLLEEAEAAAAAMADSKGDAVMGLAAPAGSSRGGGPSGADRALAAEASSGTSAGEPRQPVRFHLGKGLSRNMYMRVPM